MASIQQALLRLTSRGLATMQDVFLIDQLEVYKSIAAAAVLHRLALDIVLLSSSQSRRPM